MTRIDEALAANKGTSWTIDPAHSEASFTVRHAGLAKVRGTVPVTAGTIELGDSLDQTRVTAELDPAGISTGQAPRDEHLRSADFFEVATFPQWTFVSQTIKQVGHDEFEMTGDLTLHGVTRPITLAVEFAGTADVSGAVRAGFSARGELSRKDFGLTWNAPIEAGGVLVSDKVKLELEIAATQS